ncbi:hypothetical protein CHUAL_010830 [Chamberlinius hualienensis]
MGRRLQTVAAVTCMKTLLMVFNVIFWLTGIGILVIGVWMKVDLYKYMELTTNYNPAVSYVLITTGAVIILVGSLACCCTAKGVPALLYLYSVFLMIVFVVELSAGISGYVYRGKFRNGFEVGWNNSLMNYGKSRSGKELIDNLQSTLHCCGSAKYSDWFNTPFGAANKSVPESCCKGDHNCKHTNLDGPTPPTDINTEGCFSTIVTFVDKNIGAIGGAAMAFAFFQLIGVMLSCCLAKNINKAKYEQVA